MARQPIGRPKIYKGKDGSWHCYVTVGEKPDGKLDRRHLRGTTKAAVATKVEALEEKLRKGHVPKVGQTTTVAEWLEHWLTNIAARKCRPSTLDGYRSKIRHRLIPGLGRHRLDRLKPDHVEQYFTALEAEVKPAHALQVFRILSRALKVAEQRGKIPRNPCGLVDSPSVTREEIQPYGTAELKQVLGKLEGRLNAARWWLALALGLRQGEALGLRWSDVDLEAGVLAVRKQLQRRTWQHGCGDEPCGKRAASCPAKRLDVRDGEVVLAGGLVLADLKSRKARRTLPLLGPLLAVLREHRRHQLEARLAAGKQWRNFDLVFCQTNGMPIGPRDDWGEWKALLEESGVRDARLHDARHTAATVMLGEGIAARVVMELLGHSQISLTLGTYSHAIPEILVAAGDQMERAWTQLQPSGATTLKVVR